MGKHTPATLAQHWRSSFPALTLLLLDDRDVTARFRKIPGRGHTDDPAPRTTTFMMNNLSRFDQYRLYPPKYSRL